MDHKDTCFITRARSKGNIVDNVFERLEETSIEGQIR